MKPIKQTPLHTVLARHSERRNEDGSPVIRYFTETQWRYMGNTQQGDGKVLEKQGWSRIPENAIQAPPEALRPFERQPQVIEKPEGDSVGINPTTEALLNGNASELPVRVLYDWIEENRTLVESYAKEKGISLSGIKRSPKDEMVELLESLATEKLK